MLNQRNTSVFALIVRHPRKLYRLLNQVPVGTTVPKGTEYFHPPLCRNLGSLDILGHVKMKLPMRSQGRELFNNLLDWNQPWGSQGRIKRKR